MKKPVNTNSIKGLHLINRLPFFMPLSDYFFEYGDFYEIQFPFRAKKKNKSSGRPHTNKSENK